MDSNNYLQLGLYLAVLLVLSLPLGWYMARVMEGKSRVNRLFGGIERVFYRLCGISREHGWTGSSTPSRPCCSTSWA
jgi:K+-transporting ATPase ATPase A chain